MSPNENIGKKWVNNLVFIWIFHLQLFNVNVITNTEINEYQIGYFDTHAQSGFL